MANKLVREPENKKPMAVLRAVLTEPTINTYTEVPVSTPVSAAVFQAMRIHKIVFDLPIPVGIAATETISEAQLATRSFTTIQQIASEGIIANARAFRALSATAQVIDLNDTRSAVWDFGEQGILVTDRELRFAGRSINSNVVQSYTIAIYYTLETLEPDEYVAALTVLGSSF